MNEFTGQPARGDLPPDWSEAMLNLVSARIELIQLESREAARTATRKAIMTGAGIGLIFFGWLLALAGIIGMIAHGAQIGWHWIAIIAALLHIIPAWLLLRTAKSTPTPSFPFTRAEFIKDRQWLQNLRQSKKSND